MLSVSTKSTLVAALTDCASEANWRPVRRFLQGLSTGELKYIAGFMGWWVLESQHRNVPFSDAFHCFDESGPRFVDKCGDDGHNSILLLEYLSRCGQA